MTQPTRPMTAQLANGKTAAIALSASTVYRQQASGSASDVTTGKQGLVQVNGRFGGDDNPGGTVGATGVTVVP